jgi:predicted dienelactone hydrolase
MKLRMIVALGVLLVAGCASPFEPISSQRESGQHYAIKSAPGPHQVAVELGEWRDSARNGRVVPWKLYYPADTGTPAPIVVWSHGGGGDREGAAYLGEHLASHGFAALHIQHAGSDRAAFLNDRPSLLRGVNDPAAGEPRYRDVQFIVREVQRMADGAWSARIDPTRMGISGHSFGAITAQIAAGQFVKGYGQSLAEPAFRAAFIMSPSPPRAGYDAGEQTFTRMLMPMFHLTGTKDESPANDFQPEERREPFERSAGVDQYLVVFDNANHFTFTGQRVAQGRDWSYPGLERHLELTKGAAIAFWDAYLREDAAALAWLKNGGYAETVEGAGSFLVKN